MPKIKSLILTSISSLASVLFAEAYADDILRGVPYPLPFKYQAEETVVYSKNEKGVKTATNTISLKYRNEDILFGGEKSGHY